MYGQGERELGTLSVLLWVIATCATSHLMLRPDGHKVDRVASDGAPSDVAARGSPTRRRARGVSGSAPESEPLL